MLVWNTELWLIDHGASLYFHYSPENWELKAHNSFPQVKNHVLLPYADMLEETDQLFRAVLTPEKLKAIINLIPDEWFEKDGTAPAEAREIYYRFLQIRLAASNVFIKEAQNARAALV